ncbi:Uncharacterised protein [Mycobacterium tuberculosis]|nr:Uncharacterised protein [Mycobacterium tuberculosis]
MATVMILIANKTAISPMLSTIALPFTAFCESLINTINKGIITGKLKIAMIVLLLPAFALIAETIVKTVAKLILPNKIAKQ